MIEVKNDKGLQAIMSAALAAFAVYTEVDFHDDKTIAKWLIENPQIVGETFAKGVCQAYGVTYQAPNSSKTIYRVQLGAFEKKENAEALLNKVKAAGFKDAFIKNV